MWSYNTIYNCRYQDFSAISIASAKSSPDCNMAPKRGRPRAKEKAGAQAKAKEKAVAQAVLHVQ
jgi:hypothetical protein